MTFDPDAQITAMLAHLGTARLGERFTTGGESCDCVFDDEDAIQTDGAGGAVQVRETVVRVREDAITRPVIGATATTQLGTQDVRDWIVRDVRNDPTNNDLWRIVLARA